MPEHNFTPLFEKYPHVIKQMPETFTSHQFIQRLAQQHQALYIKALYSYRNTDAPFRTVHAILARHLHGYRESLANMGDVQSENIFGQTAKCAEWQKKSSTPQAEQPPAPSGGVTIGNVTGGMTGNIIAGGDATAGVFSPTITIGGQSVPADKEPTVAEFGQLLAEIQKELAEITAQQDALKAISPAAPFTAQGAEQSVKDVAEKVGKAEEVKPKDAQSIQKSLNQATGLLSTILDSAKTVTQKASEAAITVKPVIEKLAPLVEKVGVAAFWVARLWLPTGNP